MGFLQEAREDTYLFTIPAFSETKLVEHGFTCRLGGVSEGDFSSLNLAFHVGDHPDLVRKNRKKITTMLGSDLDALVASEQVHGHELFIVGQNDRGKGSVSYDSAIPQVDALITNEPGILLSSYYADCVPLFFLDPVHRVVALAHAGWKGTVQRIAVETIKRMNAVFGTEPNTCLAGIGPSIGRCCFQVDQQVYEQFAKILKPDNKFCFADHGGKWFINLPGINEHLMIESGLRPENITQSGLCTSCRNDLFFSYRKDQCRTGRQAALIMLKERSN